MLSVVHLTISIQSFNAIHGHVCELEKKTAPTTTTTKKKKIRNKNVINFVEVARRANLREKEKKTFYFPFEQNKWKEAWLFFLNTIFCFSTLSFSTTLLAFLSQLGHIMSHCYGANVKLMCINCTNLLYVYSIHLCAPL